MATINFLQILFSLALLLATGNASLIFSGETGKGGKMFFFERDISQTKLPKAAGKPLPPGRRAGSRAVGMEISAEAAAAIDMRSGKTLFEKKSDLPIPLASFTKLMTALVFLDSEPKWDKKLTISESDWREKPSAFNLGETLTLRDLFYAALISSDNTAAAALARGSGWSREEFIFRMNGKAAQIGMTSAHFSDVTGLDPLNTASALDAATLARAAFKEEIIRKALTMANYDLSVPGEDGKKRTVYTTNRLLDGLLNHGQFKIQGGKTGYLEESGFNFVFEVKGNRAEDLLVVVMGSESYESRFEEAKNLALWAFENFDWEE